MSEWRIDAIVLACAAQREAWQRGDRAAVEDLVVRYPDLARDPHGLLDLIYHEICLRQEARQPIDRREYRTRFPQLASQIEDLLDVHAALEAEAWEADAVDRAAERRGDPTERAGDESQSDLTEAAAVVRLSDPALQPSGSAKTEIDPLSAAVSRVGNAAASDQLVGRQFGGYEILEVVAQGGMGVVFKARQASLSRVVALKMIRTGHFASPHEIERFQAEARSAASLRHANIVSIHEVGQIAGRHFFTMDYVEGPTLEELVHGQPLPVRRAAEYLRTIAEAVQYAHDNHVLHRDLKPSNILFDARNEPHVADFGVAKRVDNELDSEQTHSIVGTPSYMPPEQANRRLGDTTPASDVYSLGAVLYEMLTGRPPFRATTPLETMMQVLHNEPAPPRLLIPSLPRDLETICMKCLEKDPRRRYPTARALADDIGRYLADEPISARRATRVERLWRKCRKRPVTAALAALVAALLLFLLIASPMVTVRERTLRRTADLRLQAAERQLRISRAHQLTAQAQAELEHHPQRALLLGVEAVNATLSAGEPPIPVAEQFLRDALDQIGGLPLPGSSEPTRLLQYSPEGQWLSAVVDSEPTVLVWDARATGELAHPQRLNGHRQQIGACAFSPVGNELVTVDWSGLVFRWRVADGQFQLAERSLRPEPLYSVQFSPDGQWLVAAGLGSTAWLWKATQSVSKPPVRLDGHQQRITQVVFSPDSRWLATVGLEGTPRLWHLDGDVARAIPLPDDRPHGTIHQVAFSPQSQWLATVGVADAELDAESQLDLYRLEFDQPRATTVEGLQTAGARSFAFQPNGERLVVAMLDGTLVVWHRDDPSDRWDSERLGQLAGGVDHLEFSPDGRSLVAVSGYHVGASHEGRLIDVWRLGTGVNSRIATIPWPTVSVLVRFAPDSQHLVATEGGNSVIVWNLRKSNWVNEGRHLRGHEATVDQMAFSPAGEQLVTSDLSGHTRIWSLGARQVGRSWATIPDDGRRVVLARELPSAACLVLCAEQGRIGTCRPSPNAVPNWQPSDGAILALGGSGDGRWLFTGDERGRVRRWGCDSEMKLLCDQDIASVPASVVDVACSHDGQCVAAVDRSGQMYLWRLDEGWRPILQSATAGVPVASADISPDARWLACACDDGRLRVWRIGESQGNDEPWIASQSDLPLVSVAFTRNGRWIVAAGMDGTVRLHPIKGDPAGREIVLHGERSDLVSLTLSPDGTRLVTSDLRGICRLWALDRGETVPEVLRIFAPPDGVERLAISGDGRWLQAGGGKTVRLWRLAHPAHGPLTWRVRTGGIRQVGFTESQWTYVIGEDGRVHIWNLDVTQLIEEANRTAGRPLSGDESREFLDDGQLPDFPHRQGSMPSGQSR